MCIPMPAQVVSMEAGTALVMSGGRPVQVTCPTQPDFQRGDWVLVYLGQIVDHLEPDEASALQALLQAIQLPTAFSHGLANPTEVEG